MQPRPQDRFSPEGTRDFGPVEQANRLAVCRTLHQLIDGYGYAAVGTPLFEYEWILEAGVSPKLGGSPVRFVEPDSGRVAVLRPDVTPQLARIAATQLNGHRRPLRLAYEAALFRRPHERARHARQTLQVGFECFGPRQVGIWVEALVLIKDALTQLAVAPIRIELGVPSVCDALLNSALKSARNEDPAALRLRQACIAALTHRDSARLEAIVATRPELAKLAEWGSPPVRAKDWLTSPEAQGAGAPDINALLNELPSDICDVTLVDLAQTFGLGVYNGPTFHAYAGSSALPVGRGGVYESAFGEPAVGFAFSVEALLAAGARAQPEARPHLIAGPGVSHGVLRQLRGTGMRVTQHFDEIGATPSEDRYADHSGNDFWYLDQSGPSLRLRAAANAEVFVVSADDVLTLQAVIADSRDAKDTACR